MRYDTSFGCHGLRSKSMAGDKAGAERPIDMALGHGMCNQAEQRIVLPQVTF